MWASNTTKKKGFFPIFFFSINQLNKILVCRLHFYPIRLLKNFFIVLKIRKAHNI